MIRGLREKLTLIRFELFFSTQLAVLFGSILFPLAVFREYVLPVLFGTNIILGALFIRKESKWRYFSIGLFVISMGIFLVRISNREFVTSAPTQLVVYFVFFVFVTRQIISQIWNATEVNKTVIIGLMSGYVSLGFLSFILFLGLEMFQPHSLGGIAPENQGTDIHIDKVMYFAFITLLSIGYGDISPITPIAQKIAVLTGLTGQFYLTIITAVIVGKYLQHNSIVQKRDSD
ncbi:MAG: potassium channel family protein [Bacteroidota bacterium]